MIFYEYHYFNLSLLFDLIIIPFLYLQHYHYLLYGIIQNMYHMINHVIITTVD